MTAMTRSDFRFVSILSDFEDRVSGAIEGIFAGVFRAPVQPAELARACAKEMDRRKKLGVGRVYVPTMYSVLLSPHDGEQLGGFSDTLAGELSTYLVSYAAERDYILKTRPVVRFLVDDDLRMGRFEVIGELLSEREIAAIVGADDDYFDPDAADDAPSGPAILAPAAAPIAPAAPAAPVAIVPEIVAPAVIPPVAAVSPALVRDSAPAVEPAVAIRPRVVMADGSREIELSGDRIVVGRLKACDICLPDVNVSREHAAMVPEGAGWVIEDLGSTNGTRLNGSPVSRMRLRDGDVITIGINELHYHETES